MWVINGLLLAVRTTRRSSAPGPPIRHADARRFALRSFPSTIGEHLGSRLDQWIVGIVTTVSAAGIYSVALGLSDALVLPGLSLGSSLFAAASRSELAHGVPKRPLLAVVAVTAAGALVLAVTAPWLIPIVFGARYRGAIVPTIILAVGSIGFGVQRTLGPFLSGRGHPGYYSLASLTAATVLGVTVLALVPHYHLLGAAIGSSAGYLAGGVVALVAAFVVGARAPEAGWVQQPDVREVELAPDEPWS
jgi:O-antigen/teichoic acid export membrane protein